MKLIERRQYLDKLINVLIILFLLAKINIFSFLANSCSGIDENFSFRLFTNRNTPFNPQDVISV